MSGSMGVSVYECGFDVFPVCNLLEVPGARLTVISGVVLGVAPAWWVSRHVVPVAVWSIPMGVSSRIPVWRGATRMAVVMGYWMGYMPPMVAGASVMQRMMVWFQTVKAVLWLLLWLKECDLSPCVWLWCEREQNLLWWRVSLMGQFSWCSPG